MPTRTAPFAFVLALVACGNAADKPPTDDADKKAAQTDVVASASASAAPPVPPLMAEVRAGKLHDPIDDKTFDLVETPLDKCYGFAGWSMKLPPGSTLHTMTGARACLAYLPNGRDKLGLLVQTDAIKTKMWQRSEITKITKRHLDEPDAFLFEHEMKEKPQVLGWVDRQVGPNKTQCNVVREGVELSVDEELAFLEVCRTLAYADPKKK